MCSPIWLGTPFVFISYWSTKSSSTDGDLGSPNLFVPLAEEICTQKIDLLLKHFRTQSNKHWFTRSTFEAMHRIRGVECASSTGFAEAFYCRKLVLGLI